MTSRKISSVSFIRVINQDRLESKQRPGSSLMTILLALALVAFQSSDDSYWYTVAGGAFLVGCYLLHRHYRASRHEDNDDSRKLYNTRNA